MQYFIVVIMGALVVILGLLVYVWQQLRVTQSQVSQLSSQLASLDAQHNMLDKRATQLKQQLVEVHTGTLGMGTTLKKLIQQLAVAEERQSMLEASDPDSKMYQQAVFLAQQGAEVSVIMNDCGLPQGEAELLISLHRTI